MQKLSPPPRADVCATSLTSIASSCVGKAFLGRAKKDKGYEIRRDVALVDDPVLRGGAPFQHGHQDPADDGVGGKQCEEVSTGFDIRGPFPYYLDYVNKVTISLINI